MKAHRRPAAEGHTCQKKISTVTNQPPGRTRARHRALPGQPGWPRARRRCSTQLYHPDTLRNTHTDAAANQSHTRAGGTKFQGGKNETPFRLRRRSRERTRERLPQLSQQSHSLCLRLCVVCRRGDVAHHDVYPAGVVQDQHRDKLVAAVGVGQQVLPPPDTVRRAVVPHDPPQVVARVVANAVLPAQKPMQHDDQGVASLATGFMGSLRDLSEGIVHCTGNQTQQHHQRTAAAAATTTT